MSHLPRARPRIALEFGDPPEGFPEEYWLRTCELGFEGKNVSLDSLVVGENTVVVDNDARGGRKVGIGGEQVTLANVNNDVAVDDRLLRSFTSRLARCMYLGPFRNAVNVGGSEQYYDLAIGQQFVSQFEQLKSGADAEKNEAVARLLREIERIFDFPHFDLNAAPDTRSLQVFIGDRSYRLSELGAGLAHFILTLVSALVYQPSWLLIDEPESNLHAFLQLDLLMALGSVASQGVVFATHSLGLAQEAADRVLVVENSGEDGATLGEFEGHPSPARLASALSFGGIPALGFERILLVEGKHDVKVFKHLLGRYRLGGKVLVLPLGGSDMVNGGAETDLLELQRIGAPLAAIVDSEADGPDSDLSKSRRDFVALCDRLDIPCHVLDRRATENYFPAPAVDAVHGARWPALGPYDPVPRGWPKHLNWRIAWQMRKRDLDTTDLGKFLEGLVRSG